jgi:hypothetical protein
MPEPRFDPSKAVTFDLGSGLVHVEGAPSRLLVPAEALGAICAAAGPEATTAFGRSIGVPMGRRLASRFAARNAEGGTGVRGASIESVVDHLGGELAILGLGALGLERWGHALVLVVDHSPLEASGDSLFEAVLAGSLEAATGRPVRVLTLGRDGARARFLVTGDAAMAKARAWLAQGMSWGEVIARLHGRSDAARGDA